MKITNKTVTNLISLSNGEIIPASLVRNKLVDELIAENILIQKGKHRKKIQCLDKNQLNDYLYNHYQITDLKQYREASTRAEYTTAGGDSKLSSERAFKGFLVNSYEPIQGKLNGEDFIVNPSEGSFVFIYDFDSFTVDKTVTIVGVENALSFRHIQKQTHLFANITPLFVSRYPQNQSKDFISWLKSMPNEYLHFGDFDIAGIGIYINEYKKYLGERSSFLIPDNIKSHLRQHGNRNRYDIQRQNFESSDIKELALQQLVELICKEKKGLDQEFFIQ